LSEEARLTVHLVLTHEDFGKHYTEDFSIMTKISELKQIYFNAYDTKVEDQEIKIKYTRTGKLFLLMDDDKTLEDYCIRWHLD